MEWCESMQWIQYSQFNLKFDSKGLLLLFVLFGFAISIAFFKSAQTQQIDVSYDVDRLLGHGLSLFKSFQPFSTPRPSQQCNAKRIGKVVHWSHSVV